MKGFKRLLCRRWPGASDADPFR